MREEVLFETVEVNAFFLTVEDVLVSEEQLDLLLAERYSVLHQFGFKKAFFSDEANAREVETCIGLLGAPEHVPQFLSQFVSYSSHQSLFSHATGKKLELIEIYLLLSVRSLLIDLVFQTSEWFLVVEPRTPLGHLVL